MIYAHFNTYHQTVIYTLSDPRTGEVRYIGKTVVRLSSRLSQHIHTARSRPKRHLSHWILSLPARPLIKHLIVVRDDGVQAEQGMIAFYKAKGARLTNATEGGEGTIGCKPTPETLAKRIGLKWSEEAKARIRGRSHSLESRQKMSEAAKRRGNTHGFAVGHKHSEETKAKMKGRKRPSRPHTEETRRKMSLAQMGNQHWLGRHHTEESKAKISTNNKGHPVSDEWRANLCAGQQRRWARIKAEQCD